MNNVTVSRYVCTANALLTRLNSGTHWKLLTKSDLKLDVSDCIMLDGRTFAECLTVRRHTDLPFVMDETVNDVGSLLDCHREAAADVVNIKISKFGGLTKAKQVKYIWY